MFNARIKVVNFIGIFSFIEMTYDVTPTHCHFIKIPDQVFVLNRFDGRSVFLSNVRVKTDKQTDLGKSVLYVMFLIIYTIKFVLVFFFVFLFF